MPLNLLPTLWYLTLHIRQQQGHLNLTNKPESQCRASPARLQTGHEKDDSLSLVSQSWILVGFRSPPLQTLPLPGFCILRCGVSLRALSRDRLGSHGAAAGTTGCYETRAGLVKSLKVSASSSGA